MFKTKRIENRELGFELTQVINTEQPNSNELWFVGTDVATRLGYSNPWDAVGKFVDECDKMSVQMNNLANRDAIRRGNPNMTIINESGLYSLILSSKLPTAKKFKHWVTSEVLPTLRKDGMYVIGEKQMSDDEMVLRVITLLNNKIKDKDKTIDYQQTIIESQQPKVFAYMTFLENSETISVASAANLLSNSGFKIGRNELYEWLRRHHFVYKNSTKPISKYVPKYFTESVENLLGNQETTTRITHKGLDMIYKKFVEENKLHQAPPLI